MREGKNKCGRIYESLLHPHCTSISITRLFSPHSFKIRRAEAHLYLKKLSRCFSVQDKKCKKDLAKIAATSTLTPFRFNMLGLPVENSNNTLVKHLRGYQEKKTERFLQEHAFRSRDQRGKLRVGTFRNSRRQIIPKLNG